MPVLWLLISSLKSNSELSAYPIQLLPKHPLHQLITYYFTLRYSPIMLAMLRTFVLGISTAFITCITSAMAGYAFARIKGAGSRQLFSLVIALLIVPNIILLVPQFILYAHYHLIRYLLALVPRRVWSNKSLVYLHVSSILPWIPEGTGGSSRD